jgi:hypothetical protein
MIVTPKNDDKNSRTSNMSQPKELTKYAGNQQHFFKPKLTSSYKTKFLCEIRHFPVVIIISSDCVFVMFVCCAVTKLLQIVSIAPLFCHYRYSWLISTKAARANNNRIVRVAANNPSPKFCAALPAITRAPCRPHFRPVLLQVRQVYRCAAWA